MPGAPNVPRRIVSRRPGTRRRGGIRARADARAGADSWAAPASPPWARRSAAPSRLPEHAGRIHSGGARPWRSVGRRAPTRGRRRPRGRNTSASRARTTSWSCSATGRWWPRRPEHLLDDDTTPTDKFYIRNNGQIPDEAKEPDSLEDRRRRRGQQASSSSRSASSRRRFQPVTRRMVLECGGNGRSFFTPQARGNQWTNGGAGCAEWTGVRLADVLKAAGVKPSAVFTAHYGADPHLSGDAQGRDLARRADRQGDGPQQPHRVGHERAAAAESSTAVRCA